LRLKPFRVEALASDERQDRDRDRTVREEDSRLSNTTPSIDLVSRILNAVRVEQPQKLFEVVRQQRCVHR